MIIDSSGQDLDAEEKRANDPEPRESDYHRGYLVVHWRGYVKDHEPTAKHRANGRAVIVYDDNQDGVFLRPTAYPHMPEPWASRCIKYAVGVPTPMCGGREGRRFLSNGQWQCVVDEETFQGAIASGWRDVGDLWYEPDELPGERVVLVCLRQSIVEWGDRVPVSNVGGIWIQTLYVDLLQELGATEAVGLDTYADDRMLRVIVPGVAVVMGVRNVVETP